MWLKKLMFPTHVYEKVYLFIEQCKSSLLCEVCESLLTSCSINYIHSGKVNRLALSDMFIQLFESSCSLFM
jgi:hypothetical protein